MKTSASKTQIRVLNLLSLRVSDDYDENAKTLENISLPRDAMPRGETWRSVAKLSDAELLAKLSVKPEFFNVHNVHETNY